MKPVALLLFVLSLQTQPGVAHDLRKLVGAIPTKASQCNATNLATLRQSSEEFDRWAAGLAWQRTTSDRDAISRVSQIIIAKSEVDKRLTEVLKLRGTIATLVEQKQDRDYARNYFAITSQLIDLSGRLRFTLRDAVNNAVNFMTKTQSAEGAAQLIDLVTSRNAVVAADVFAPYLSETDAPISLPHKRKVIDLIGRSGDATLIPPLLDMLEEPAITPDLKLSAIVAIVNIGVPQDWRPGQSKDEEPPPVTARELWSHLAKLQFSAEYDPSYTKSRNALLARLKALAEKGNERNALRVCGVDVFVGDWLLIRNPSPYNQVTDLAPGLFTHVGVVAAEKGQDGITRLVVVEVPERGDRVPATNVDAYLARTLHYLFLRHPDPTVGGAMATAAAAVIGNETQFDLNFRTENVTALKGKQLSGERIHTYCAGLLHLCAQETDRPLSDFFPLVEGPPGGHCLANLRKLGMSIGEDFVSPTGALLSPNLEIVGRREPMYDPGREVKENIYDHFGKSLVAQELTPSPDAVQALREKLAGLAKYNPWLAKALADANNVSEHMDLEAAAKAAAVIETLDEVADQSMREFFAARAAMNRSDESGLTPEQRTSIAAYRKAHAALYQKSLTGTLSPRDLRVTLVKHYSEAGKRRIDERFFNAKGKVEN